MKKMTLRATLLAVSTLLTLSQVTASSLDQNFRFENDLLTIQWDIVQENKTNPKLNKTDVAIANENEDDLLAQYMYGNATEITKENIAIANENEDDLLAQYMYGNAIEITKENVAIANENEDDLLAQYMYGNAQNTEAVTEIEANNELLAYADNSKKEGNIFSNALKKINNLFN